MGSDANLKAMAPPFRLGCFYFAHFAYGGAFVAYLPLYLAWRGLQPGEIAWVLALPQLARSFAPAAWGWFADRSGAQRGIVAFSCAAMAAGFGMLPYTQGLVWISWVIGVVSLLSAGALPLVEAVTLGAPAGQAGRYGPIRLWGSVGFIAMLLAGGAWLERHTVDLLPLAMTLCALASLAAALGLPSRSAQAAPPATRLRFSPAAKALLAAGFCMAAAHGTLYTFLTLHLERAGYGGTMIGLLWTLGVLAEIAVFLYLPALFRRYSLSGILVFSFACAVLRFAAIGWGADFLWVLVPAQLLHAATFGSFPRRVGRCGASRFSGRGARPGAGAFFQHLLRRRRRCRRVDGGLGLGSGRARSGVLAVRAGCAGGRFSCSEVERLVRQFPAWD